MNKERRKEIARLINQLDEARGLLSDLAEAIETLRDEEQDTFDNLPEGFQASERGERIQAAVDALDNAYSEIDCIDLDSVQSYLEEAAE